MNTNKFTFSFFIFISAIFLLGFNSYSQEIKGNGNVVTQERTITSFTRLSIDGVFNVFINQGEKEVVKVETDENLQSVIETINTGSTLNIKWKEKASVKKSTKMNIYVTIKELKSRDISGVGDVSTTSILKLENLELKISGVGNTSLEMNCKSFTADISSVGNIKLKGTADNVSVTASGTGNLKALDFIVKKLSINVSGTGNVEVYADEEINITSSGIGNISYKGNAVVKTMNTSGIGKVKKL